MQKKWIGTLLAVTVAGGLISSQAFAFQQTDANAEIFSSEEAVVSYFYGLADDENFGGMYYDDDGVLVVNVVEDAMIAMPYNTGDVEVKIETVTHSLVYLEAAKDYLVNDMLEYDILMLDANEVTNQVDIYLSDMGSKDAVYEIMQEAFPDINVSIIDYSGFSVDSTVAYERPNYDFEALGFGQESEEEFSTDAISPRMSIAPGMPIRQGNGYYTMGFATSSSRGFSCGHGFTGTQSLYRVQPFGFDEYIGTTTSYYGGSYGDYSRLSIHNIHSFTAVRAVNYASAGQNVQMFGATSGITKGTILQTNVTVSAPAPYLPLTGMSTASYRCDYGDSGAGVFLNSSTLTTGVGIQSGMMTRNGVWQYSIFTPAIKFA